MNVKKFQTILIVAAVVAVGAVLYFSFKPKADVTVKSIDFLTQQTLTAEGSGLDKVEYIDGKIQLAPQ